METIACKFLGFARHLTTKTSASGFEGPASSTSLDDGFGNPVVKGQLTLAYDCFYTEKFYKNGVPYYDGEIEIPNTRYNRAKIAVLIRSKDMRVIDRELEQKILAENKKSTAARSTRFQFDDKNSDVPSVFDGRYAIARRSEVSLDDETFQDPGDDTDEEIPAASTAKNVAPEEEEEAPAKMSVAEFSAAETQKKKKPRVLPVADVEGVTPAAEAAV